MKKNFTKIAFHSRLFKGRGHWYFCYLKSERLAYVLTVLAGRSVSDTAVTLRNTAARAAQITRDIVYAAAGETSEEALFASLFSMLSRLRLEVSLGHMSKETAQVLVEEYEVIVERLAGEVQHLSLTISPQDLAVPAVVEEPLFTPLPSSFDATRPPDSLKDIPKGHPKNRTQKDSNVLKEQSRGALILDLVRKNNGISIKDISKVVQDCSEKTIQRELNAMIERGVVVREGERRWSTYRSV